jgi:hypothetical protein
MPSKPPTKKHIAFSRNFRFLECKSYLSFITVK